MERELLDIGQAFSRFWGRKGRAAAAPVSPKPCNRHLMAPALCLQGGHHGGALVTEESRLWLLRIVSSMCFAQLWSWSSWLS